MQEHERGTHGPFLPEAIWADIPPAYISYCHINHVASGRTSRLL